MQKQHISRRKGRSIGRWLYRRCCECIIGVVAMCVVLVAHANPMLEQVVSGNISIQQEAHSTVINQASQKAIIHWQSFNIGQQESVHFQQPDGGVVLNRINPSQGASSIYGKLTATGQVILVNPAGIYLGPSAYVNVGGLVASTADIENSDFSQGNYRFSKPSPYAAASVINEGQIVAAEHGLVALVAPGVVNKGLIQANLGHIVLASGNTFTLDFTGDGLINFSVDEKVMSPSKDQNGHVLRDGVLNTGQLLANGGTILITAKTASNILDHMINMEGIAETHAVMEINNHIYLLGDKDLVAMRVAAERDVPEKNQEEKSAVSITGHPLLLDAPMSIDVSGHLNNITIPY